MINSSIEQTILNNSSVKERSNNCELAMRMKKVLYDKYSFSQNYYYTKALNQILLQQGQYYIRHKDAQAYDEDSNEYIETYYPLNASKGRVRTIAYYYRYHWQVPRLFFDQLEFDLMIQKYYQKRKKYYYQEAIKLLDQSQDNKQGPIPNNLRLNLNKLNQQNQDVLQRQSFKPILMDITFIREQYELTRYLLLGLMSQSAKSNTCQKINLNELELAVPISRFEEKTKLLNFVQYLTDCKNQNSDIKTNSQTHTKRISNDIPKKSNLQQAPTLRKLNNEKIRQLPQLSPRTNQQIQISIPSSQRRSSHRTNSTETFQFAKGVEYVSDDKTQSKISNSNVVQKIMSPISQQKVSQVVNLYSTKSVLTKLIFPKQTSHPAKSKVGQQVIQLQSQAIKPKASHRLQELKTKNKENIQNIAIEINRMRNTTKSKKLNVQKVLQHTPRQKHVNYYHR